MKANDYWLISIDEEQVTVSLVLFNGATVDRIIIGKPKDYRESEEDSLVIAVDASLSDTALMANLDETAEPESAAFVLSPFSIDIDGQILPEKFTLIESVCKKLKLKPMGFIGNDDAFVEAVTVNDNFPSSFILTSIGQHQFNLSLVYFGKIKERFHETFTDEFSPKLVENILNKLSTESALPPVLIFFGNQDPSIIENIKNYPWIGKKIGDIFFHLPEIKFFALDEINKVWSEFISHQIMGVDPEIKPEIITKPEPEPEPEPKPEPEPEPAVLLPEPETIPEPVIPMQTLGFELAREPRPKRNFHLPHFPKIKLPHLKFNLFLWPFAFIPLIFLGIWLFAKTEITLYLNPFDINTTVSVTLDSTATTFTPDSSIIPVTVQSFDQQVTGKIATTGQRIIGEKARGSIVIYNKQEKVQNLPKGAILTASGLQFELLTPVQIAGSTSDFAEGIMKFGQTKTVISASAIGPESNLIKEAKLIFKDFSENLLVAKVELDFSGGTKNQVNVVSKQDKIALENQLKEEIKTAVNKKINEDVNNLNGALLDTIQTKQKRIEFDRNLDEQTDELSATVDATVTVFILPNNEKNKIISSLVGKENTNPLDYKNFNYNLKMEIDKIDASKATGKLTISGKAAPKINIDEIRAKIAGKTKTDTLSYFKNNLTHFYNWEMKPNLPLLPLIGKNITIITKIN